MTVFSVVQRQMIDLTRTTGQKLLFEGKHEQAVPAAMQSLRFAIDVHGTASIELVPSYLILGEASIGELSSVVVCVCVCVCVCVNECHYVCVYCVCE